jgi:hypothetical protein
MTTRASVTVTVADPTLNAPAFGGELLEFDGDQLFFGTLPPSGLLPGGMVRDAVVVVCDTDGSVIR